MIDKKSCLDELVSKEKKTIVTNINSYFNNLSYSEEYSYDIWLTIILIILTISIFLYFFIINKLQSFKRDWPKYKCNPFFMPFAAIINPPIDQSGLEYTAKNFSQCLDEKNRELGLLVQEPINNAMGSLFGVFDFASEMAEEIQKFILFIFNLLIQLYNFIIERLSKVINELNLIFISIVNLFGHVLAFFTSIYWMLALLLSSLKLVVAAMAMGFLLGIVIPSIVTTIVAWNIFAGLILLFFSVLPYSGPFLFLAWLAAIIAASAVIALIFAIVSTIFMIIVIIIYIIIARFVADVLKHTTPTVPEDESTQENLEESSE